MKKLNWKIFAKAKNSLMPRWVFGLSRMRYSQQNYWKAQIEGDAHGYDKYNDYRPQLPYLIREVEQRENKDATLLDLGCNCGYYINSLQIAGFTNITGIDISEAAINHGVNHFKLAESQMLVGSFEKVLPELIRNDIKFDLIYSMGATVELVHPSFDIIKNVCMLSNKYVIFFIQEWGHTTPRFYEYEFQKHGFVMVKCLRPYDGSSVEGAHIDLIASLLVFQRV